MVTYCFSTYLFFAIALLSPIGGWKNGLKNGTDDYASRLLMLLNTFTIPKTGCYDPDETHLNAPELIRHRGFPFESHSVETADGYILQIHRIPSPGRPVIIAFHGMFQSSRDFLMNCGRKPFGYNYAEGNPAADGDYTYESQNKFTLCRSYERETGLF